eukprot:scaffold76631_cov66-Phaeocystis_antarctica.AAC.2
MHTRPQWDREFEVRTYILSVSSLRILARELLDTLRSPCHNPLVAPTQVLAAARPPASGTRTCGCRLVNLPHLRALCRSILLRGVPMVLVEGVITSHRSTPLRDVTGLLRLPQRRGHRPDRRGRHRRGGPASS